jgi:hypothetical protein
MLPGICLLHLLSLGFCLAQVALVVVVAVHGDVSCRWHVAFAAVDS